jgi:carbohydrate-binding DOMON domain-containing protein
MTEEKEKPKSPKGVSRREFIAGTVGGVVVGAVVGAAAGSIGFPKTVTQTTTQTQTQTQTVTATTTTGWVPIPSKWDLTADVVVIGAGGAGFPAALAAQAAGA